jgi:hypothetical protein
MIELIIVLLIIGAALYLLRLVPIDATIRSVIYVVVIVGVLIYLLRHLAVLGL